ncbi:MAG: PH domain-containing protein [Pedobacter sp.]|nr:MAG: PH domain-containing protein [Pedobacter sp.]
MQEFTNEAIDIDALPQFQHVELTAPDPLYWRVILINILIFALVIGGTIGCIAFFQKDFRPLSIYFTIAFVLLFGLIFILHKVAFKKRGYALREKDVVYKSGVIAEKTSIVPINRIQHVALKEGMLSRIYKLATLEVHTAGGSSGNLNIAGIPIDQARAIKDALLRKLDFTDPE